MAPYKAFIFDLNGTMIDDMAFHQEAWSNILNNDLQASLSQDVVKANMYGKNEEVLTRIFGAGRFTPEQMEDISLEKERRYQSAFRPHLHLLPGLMDFLDKARHHGIKLAIGSAAIPFNIDFVIDNLSIRDRFSVIVSASDVEHSKPHPETYTKAAQLLHVSPAECVVFEDAPKGVEAAQNAGMPAVVITTMHNEDEFRQYPNSLMFIKDYTDPRLDVLFQ